MTTDPVTLQVFAIIGGIASIAGVLTAGFWALVWVGRWLDGVKRDDILRARATEFRERADRLDRKARRLP